MKVHILCEEKKRPVYTLASHKSVGEAIDLMSAKKVSALIVTEADQPVGIFAERDIFRYCQKGRMQALPETVLREVMADQLIVAHPEDDISRMMTVMLHADIRHLPVSDGQKIIGLLNLRDLIEQQMKSLGEEIDQLNNYIEDLHEAGSD